MNTHPRFSTQPASSNQTIIQPADSTHQSTSPANMSHNASVSINQSSSQPNNASPHHSPHDQSIHQIVPEPHVTSMISALSLSSSNQSNNPTVNQSVNQSANQFPNQPDARHELRLLISSSQVGSIIGKSGLNVKHIRDVSQCYLSILKTDWQTFDRVLVIRGSITQASKAVEMIGRYLLIAMRDRGEIEPSEHAINPTTGHPDNDDWIEECSVAICLLVHRQIVGSLIGKGGVIIKSTQQATNVKIQVGNDVMLNSTEKTVTLYGTPHCLHDAMMRIIPQISAAASKIQGRVNRPYIPPSPAAVAMQTFTHPGDRNMPMQLPMPYMTSPFQQPMNQPMQNLPSVDQFQLEPMSDRNSFASTMSNHSTPMTPQLGHTPQPFSPFFGFTSPPFVPEFGALPSPMFPIPALNPSLLTHNIVIPARSAGMILGKNGEIVRTLRSATGCHISIEEENEMRPGERVVTLHGTLAGITAANQFIMSQLSSQRAVAPMPAEDQIVTNINQGIFS